MPVTFKVDSAAAEVTDREVPIPTLPATLRDDPMPTKPEKNPVPDTFKL